MRRLAVAVTVVLGVLMPAPALACSTLPSLTLEELLAPEMPYGEVTGIYEQSHIAGTPNLILRDVRTVSVVTRYWGLPPYLGREMHGNTTILGRDSCGNWSGEVGDVKYGYVTERHPRADVRSLPLTLIGQGGLSQREEAVLLEAFGPPVELDTAWQTRLAAHAQLWAWPTVFVVVVAGLAVFAGRRVYRRHRRRLRRSTVDG